MFTPPPSPNPFRVAPPRREPSPASKQHGFLTPEGYSSPSFEPSFGEQLSLSTEVKQRTTRRIRWTILLVPAILILITASTRYLSHPAMFDSLSGETYEYPPSLVDWHLHKRHPQAQSSPGAISFPTVASSSASPSASASSSSNDLPTIPQTPPVLPTPFPRPLTAVNQNFSTVGCQNFFTNMTSSEAFLECRPFSLLIKTSADFLEAQDNLTALNNIIWGTCNTDTNADQCVANMAWFAQSLQSSCSEELSNDNSLISNTLIELQAYGLMRDAACMSDPSTNAYCYVEAVHNSNNPSDLYFYQLPCGIALPQSAKPTCSSCTKSLMSLYTSSLNLTSLSKTYEPAALIANGACGANYVQTTAVVSSAVATTLPLATTFGTLLFALASIMTLS